MILTDSGDHLVIKRPDNSANNLVIGKLYVDIHGNCEVENITKGYKSNFFIHR